MLTRVSLLLKCRGRRDQHKQISPQPRHRGAEEAGLCPPAPAGPQAGLAAWLRRAAPDAPSIRAGIRRPGAF